MEARYDLAKYIAGFDFFHWLVIAKMRGTEKIVFGIENPKENKWKKDVVLRRFRSIIEPGPELAGLTYRIGSGGSSGVAFPDMANFVEFCKRNGTGFERLVSPIKITRGPEFTVTLRNETRFPDKNSNEKAWRKFANEIGAMVIEDYEDTQIHLHDRMAFYSTARMNFGVMNGPMHLISLTPYPVAMFKANISAGPAAKHGIPNGTQLPWAKENQRLVWEDDAYDNIMRWFEQNQKGFV